MGWAPPSSQLMESGKRISESLWTQRYEAGARAHWAEPEKLLVPALMHGRFQLLSRMFKLEPGDYVLVPRTPSDGEFTISRVAGAYGFDDSHYETIHPDLGHFIRIDQSTPVTRGYTQTAETKRIASKFSYYRSAINLVGDPNYRDLIVSVFERTETPD